MNKDRMDALDKEASEASAPPMPSEASKVINRTKKAEKKVSFVLLIAINGIVGKRHTKAADKMTNTFPAFLSTKNFKT